jgi:tetrahydromethanopterin S-methyltransferase subunit C
MPTRETDGNASLGTATKQVAEHASSLARLEIELATLELKRKITTLGMGIALGLGAAIFGLFMLGFLFAALAAGLSTAMPTWAALLITTGILFVIMALLGVLALGRIKKGTPPVPEQAIEEAKRTSAALKSNGT